MAPENANTENAVPQSRQILATKTQLDLVSVVFAAVISQTEEFSINYAVYLIASRVPRYNADMLFLN